MAFQREVGGSAAQATDYHDLVTKVVAMMTSQHIATVAVNAAGTGYTVGDIVTLTHASAYLDARFEVLTVGGSGDITSLRIVDGGAFAVRATSATVSVGGSGYAVGDVIEVQGGSTREKAKFQVATLSGSAVATVTLFETGGAYSSTPSNPAATVGIGPTAFAGDDACTLTVTYGTLVGTTGLSVTGGTGSSATVDVTLAESGWAVDDRNTNSLTVNGVTNEKEVVLVGDASGFTNKPFVSFVTGTSTSGIDTRYWVGCYGMTAHNPLLEHWEAPGLSPGRNAGTGAFETGAYLLCDENQAQNMDFWLTVNDRRVAMVVNNNSGAGNTDDGIYHQAYLGYLNRFGTESEQPYPMLIGASANTPNLDESASSGQISGLPEVNAPTGSTSGWNYWDEIGSDWENLANTINLQASSARTRIVSPMAQIAEPTAAANTADIIADDGPIVFWNGVATLNRASPSRVLYPVPGSASDLHSLFPFTICVRPDSGTINTTQDRAVGQFDGLFWVHATDNAGAQITNFSQDYVEIGSDRYRVFQNHVHSSRYQYIAILEDV